MQPRQLNLKFLVGLALAGVLVPVGVQLSHVVQVKRSAEVMLSRAEKAYAVGDLDEAVRCYTYYVNYQPQDSGAFGKLALLSADQAKLSKNRTREVGRIYPILEQAVHRNPDNLELLRRMAEFSVELGRVQVASEYFVRLVKAFPEDADLQLKLGHCLVATGAYQRGATALEAVIARDPANIQGHVELSTVLREQLGKNDRADAVMEQMMAANPESARACLERGRYRWRTGQKEGAKADIARALELAPSDLDVLLTAAEVANSERNFEQSQQYLDQAVKLFPGNERVDQNLITLKLGQGKKEDAIALLEKSADRNPEDFRVLLPLADLQLETANVSGVQATIKRMQTARYSRQIVEFYESQTQMLQGKWREACSQLEKLRPISRKFPDPFGKRIELCLGTCYEQLGLPDRRLDAFERAVTMDPGMLPARLGYAAALYQTGRLDRALEEYLKLVRVFGLEEFVKTRNLRNTLYQLLSAQIARLPEEQRDWTELERFVAEVEKSKEVDPPEATLMRAELLFRQKKAEEALKLVAAQREKHPEEVRLHAAAASLTAVRDPEQALTILKEGAQASGESAELCLARASVALRLGGQRGAKELKSLEEQLGKLSEEDQVRLWRGLGAAYYQLGDRQQAKRFWRYVADARPDDSQVRLMMFDAAREVGDEAGMMEVTADFKKLLGTQSAEWNFCEASRIVWQVHNRQMNRELLSAVGRYLKKAASLRPRWSSIPCLEAEISVIDGQLDDAIGHFRRAAALGPLAPAHLGQFVRLLYTRGRYDEAQEWMTRRAGLESSPAMKMLGSELAMRFGNLTESLQMAADTVAKSSNPIDFLWYGQFLARADRKDEAEKAFLRAMELGPSIPEVWLALVSQLAASGKTQAAQDVVRRAQVNLPEDQIPVVLAQCYDLLGDADRAEQYYLSAISLYPRNFALAHQAAGFFVRANRSQQAKQCLLNLLKLGAQNPHRERATLVWARRAMAGILVKGGGFYEQEQALALLDENAADGKPYLDDLHLKAIVLASRPLRQSQLKAVELLEQVRKEVSNFQANDRFLLAQLYDRTGRWNMCRPQMITLVTENPEEPRYLASYVQMLLQHDTPTEEIQPWLNRLEKRLPDSPITLGLKARLLVKDRQADQAVSLLKTLIPTPLTPKDLWRLRDIARLLEELRQYGPAEGVLTEYAQGTPSGRLDLAAFLARRATLPQALDQCEAALKDLPVLEVLPVAVAAAREAQGGPRLQDLRRIQAWFEKAWKEHPDSKALAFHWAGFLDLQGRYPEEIRLYRDFLARQDLSERERAIVSNNLVYLLVTQGRDVEEALKLIDHAISILGPSPQLRDTRALALLANGQSREAIDELKKAIADGPTGVNYFHLALAHVAANDLRAAAQAMQTAKDNHQLRAEAVPAIERAKYQDLVNKLGLL